MNYYVCINQKNIFLVLKLDAVFAARQLQCNFNLQSVCLLGSLCPEQTQISSHAHDGLTCIYISMMYRLLRIDTVLSHSTNKQ
jgi:hypothetical protein